MQPSSEQINAPSVILLDVYETLLDMTDVERRVNALLDSKRGYTIWFELFMQYCFVDNCTTQFHDFSAIAKATMQMTGHMLGRSLNEYDITNILELLKHLPVQEGVPRGLSMLNDMGFRIAALSNAPEQTVRHRMESTGLVSYFAKVLSAERIKKYKPCTDVYEWAAAQMNIPAAEVLVVSAHGWDIAGAANASMQTAYLKQGRQVLYPLAPEPNLTCNSLENLAQQLQTTSAQKPDPAL